MNAHSQRGGSPSSATHQAMARDGGGRPADGEDAVPLARGWANGNTPGGSPSSATDRAMARDAGGRPADGGDAVPPRRKHPARGVFISLGHPNIVFLTVCTKDRRPWLTRPHVHESLRQIWTQASAWLVGRYVLMPDHLHLFCAPNDLSFSLNAWVAFWKRRFSCLHLPGVGEWQRDCWDTRLRRGENYDAKWEYVRQNPVRRGLCAHPDDWPYQGELHVLRW